MLADCCDMRSFAIVVVLLDRFSAGSRMCDIVLDRSNYKDPGTWNELKTCKLHRYYQSDFVECLDHLDTSPPNRIGPSRTLREFRFIGDSRIRHQFKSFINVLFH